MNCAACGTALVARRGGFLGLQKQLPPFCPGCGEATQSNCEICGKKLTSGVAFCENCGAEVSHRKPALAQAGANAPSTAIVLPVPSHGAQPVVSATPRRAAWSDQSQHQFQNWCRRQAELAPVYGLIVRYLIYSKLSYPSWSTEVNAAADRLDGDAADKARRAVLLLADADLTPLGRDLEPNTFAPAAEIVVNGINQDLDQFVGRVPAAAPLLHGLRLGPEHSRRLSDEQAGTCRREFGRLLHELQQYQFQVKAGRPLFVESTHADVGGMVRNFGLGAMAALNPLVGVPMLAASVFGAQKQQEQRETQCQAVLHAFNSALECMTALDEAYPRTVIAIGNDAAGKVAHVAKVMADGLLRSGIAENVAWHAINEAEVCDLRKVAAELYQEAPFMRDELASLPLSPETAEALR